jgi:hypothetical protein
VTKQSNLINLKLSSDDFNQYKYKIIATCFNTWIKESHTAHLCHFSGVGLTSPTKVGKIMLCSHLSHRLKPVAKNLISKTIDMENRRLVCSSINNLINLKLSLDDFNQYKYKLIATFFKMWIRESIPTPLCHFSGINNKKSRSIQCPVIP